MIITPEIQPTDVAGRLRAERERLKYSLTVMAEKAEIGRATQQSYEAGATSPTVEYLAKLGRLGFDTINLRVKLRDVHGKRGEQTRELT